MSGTVFPDVKKIKKRYGAEPRDEFHFFLWRKLKNPFFSFFSGSAFSS